VIAFKATGIVEDVVPGKLRGQEIAKLRLSDNDYVTFDVISNIYKVNINEEIAIEIHDEKPDNIEEYDFCGHGFLVDDENRIGKTIISIWGIVFVFSKKIGLNINKKYYICLKKIKTASP